MSVTGFTAPGFEHVRHVFESRYAAGTEELGATCAVYHAGEVRARVEIMWRVIILPSPPPTDCSYLSLSLPLRPPPCQHLPLPIIWHSRSLSGLLTSCLSCCLSLELPQLKVSLCCGWRDDSQEVAYTEDTLANVFSCTKGMAALSLAVLVEQGLVSYDDLVTKHWPEFGAGGKGGCTVAQLASHQAGLPVCREDVSIKDFLVEGRIAEKLAAQVRVYACMLSVCCLVQDVSAVCACVYHGIANC